MSNTSTLPFEEPTHNILRWFALEPEAAAQPGSFGEDIFSLICPDWNAPSLIVDAGNGQIAYANSSCLNLLKGRFPAAIREGRLVICSAEIDRRFHDSLRQISSDLESARIVGRCDLSGSWFSIAIRNARGLKHALLRRALPEHHSSTRLVIVELAVTGGSPEPAAMTALAEACSLSRAETELVRLLASGRSLPEIAKCRNVTLATMRQRLKCALAKTNCHRQTELVHLVMSLCPESHTTRHTGWRGTPVRHDVFERRRVNPVYADAPELPTSFEKSL